jgi:hypothetical protein
MAKVLKNADLQDVCRKVRGWVKEKERRPYI